MYAVASGTNVPHRNNLEARNEITSRSTGCFGPAVFTVTAHADEVYTYTGNPLLNYNTTGMGITTTWIPGIPSCECSLDGSFTMSQPIGPGNYALLLTIDPIAYSFSGNGYTYNQSNSNEIFQVSTDPDGNITFWYMQDGGFSMDFYGSAFESTERIGGAFQQGTIGTWTMADPVSTPEPSSFALLGIGLLGLAMLKQRVTLRSLA